MYTAKKFAMCVFEIFLHILNAIKGIGSPPSVLNKNIKFKVNSYLSKWVVKERWLQFFLFREYNKNVCKVANTSSVNLNKYIKIKHNNMFLPIIYYSRKQIYILKILVQGCHTIIYLKVFWYIKIAIWVSNER